MADQLLPRALEETLTRGLKVMPVVAVTGARQTGKSTLARVLARDPDRLYVTLDDIDVLDQARNAPGDLVRRAPRMTLDEVQRAPDLLLAIKRAVDERREPGRFVLTGSANLLLMKQVSESLAGRAAYLTLWPLTRREQLGLGRTGLWDDLLDADCSDWPEVMGESKAEKESWHELARRGGFPTPAHELTEIDERSFWFEGYLTTYLERDLRDLSAVEQLADFRRLMRAACLRLGGILNQADLARDVALPPSTVQRYMNLLEVSYQLIRLPTFFVNRTKRLVRSPKIYWNDTGMALHVAGGPEPTGAHLENIVLNDLLAWGATRIPAPEILYWRTSKGEEVDFIVETGSRVLPIEVKSGRTVGMNDVRHLKSFLTEYADLTSGGLVLYDGTETFWISKDILVVPWWQVI